MKHFYFAATIEQNGRRAAMTIHAGGDENLMHTFSRIQGLEFVNACESKKQAEQIVQHWNDCYRANGTYLYSD